MTQIEKLQKSFAHKPFRKDVPEYARFLTQNINKIEQLTINFPYLNLAGEKEYFQMELNGCKQG
jgi:hypothetical protein